MPHFDLFLALSFQMDSRLRNLHMLHYKATFAIEFDNNMRDLSLTSNNLYRQFANKSYDRSYSL